MHEQAPQEIRPGSPPASPKEGDGTFTLKKKFPGEGPQPSLPAPRPPEIRKKGPARLVLPVVLLIVVVGVVAYVVQNLPKRQRPGPPKGPGGDVVIGKDVLKFSEDLRHPDPEVNINLFHARWDHSDPKRLYAAEIERESKGHYDFLFVNPLDQAVDIGVETTECDCSRVQLATLPPTTLTELPPKHPQQAEITRLVANASWTSLIEYNRKEVKKIVGTVPAKTVGVTRLSWTNRKGEGESLMLTLTLWAQAQGAKVKTRQHIVLHVPTLVVAPIQFELPARHVGEIRPGGVKTAFVCWSATRDDPKLTLGANDDPLFKWELTQLTPKECEELEKRLMASRNTRVKAGYRVSVLILEEKEGKQLDQGSFNRYPPLLLAGAPLDNPGTRVEGIVRGDVEVRGEARPGFVDNGQIRFGPFPVGQGASAQLLLRADADVTLEAVAREKQIPPYLEVDVKEGKLTTEKKKTWSVDVRIRGGGLAGPLPPDSAVLLRKTAQGAPPRQIRIPIIGNAVQR